jgi:hypothetical protein
MKRQRLLRVLLGALATLVAASAVAYEGWIVISDEQGSTGRSCSQANGVVTGAACTGSYCDNNYLFCGNAYYGGSTIAYGSGSYTTAYTSEEYYSSQPGRAVCPFGYALVGMSAYGSYSDNIRSHCRRMNLPQLPWPAIWTRGFFSSSISEETPFETAAQMTYPFTNSGFLSGFKCTGSYCDNMFYNYTAIGTTPI